MSVRKFFVYKGNNWLRALKGFGNMIRKRCEKRRYSRVSFASVSLKGRASVSTVVTLVDVEAKETSQNIFNEAIELTRGTN